MPDVLIVGSGGAGAAAAIEARRAGADVDVIEQESTLGGAAAISGGGCFVVDTPLQRAQGHVDSPDLAFRDWLTWGQGTADEEWARYYIEHSLNDLYRWAEELGARWTRVSLQEGNSVPRFHQPENDGLGLWTTLHDAACSLGVSQWLTSSPATEIICRDGRAVGVRVQHSETKETSDIYATVVVMATGGFCSNLDMLLEHNPGLSRFRLMEGSGRGSLGTGHRVMARTGAYLTHLGDYWTYSYSTPDPLDPKGRRGIVIRGIPDAVWVNAQARRFHDENRYQGSSGSDAVMGQDPPTCWSIFDGDMVQKLAPADPYYRRGKELFRDRVRELLDNSPYIHRGDTVGELACHLGMDAATLSETVARYNSFLAEGLAKDPDFGRPLGKNKPIQTPPFYAVQFFPLVRKNFGGVKTNLRCQVADQHFDRIPGLYAAGELCGMAGGHINGKRGLGGTMLGPSIFSGRVAGACAAQEAGFGSGFCGTPDRR